MPGMSSFSQTATYRARPLCYRYQSGQYASFCFNKPGTVRYMARDQTAVTGGEVVLPAQIVVGTNTARPRTPENSSYIGRSDTDNMKVAADR